MTPRRSLILLALFPLGAGAVVLAQSHARGDRHPALPSSSGNIVVALCDGETTAEIAGVKEGETPTSARKFESWEMATPSLRATINCVSGTSGFPALRFPVSTGEANATRSSARKSVSTFSTVSTRPQATIACPTNTGCSSIRQIAIAGPPCTVTGLRL